MKHQCVTADFPTRRGNHRPETRTPPNLADGAAPRVTKKEKLSATLIGRAPAFCKSEVRDDRFPRQLRLGERR
jgi:hypothetical protein